MRIPLTVAALLLVALSGCFGDSGDDHPDDHADDHADDGHDGDNMTAGRDPVLKLAITIGNATFNFTNAEPAHGNETGNATDNMTGNATAGGNTTVPTGPGGAAPLNVTFTLDAHDLPNGTLQWTLDLGFLDNATGNVTGNSTVNGTSLPATVNHTYAAGGLFNVTYTLSVGNETVGRLAAQIDVDAGTATAILDIPFSAEGAIIVGTQGASSCGATNTVDVATHDWDLTAVLTIQRIVVHMDLGTSNVDSDIFLLDPNGETVGSSTDFNQPVLGSGSPTEDFEVEGPLAPGLYTFRVVGCVGAEMEYTITAVATVIA